MAVHRELRRASGLRKAADRTTLYRDRTTLYRFLPRLDERSLVATSTERTQRSSAMGRARREGAAPSVAVNATRLLGPGTISTFGVQRTHDP